MNVKRIIKRVLPPRVISSIRRRQAQRISRREYRLDEKRYDRFSTPNDKYASVTLSGRNLETQLTKDYHRVEKGLALAQPKSPFGADVSRRLNMLLPVASADEVLSASPFVEYARDARAALTSWNDGGERHETVSPLASTIGVHSLGPEELADFFSTRRSIRHFDPEREVPTELLAEAVRLAGMTPSVCNRQPWTAHLFRGAESVESVLRYQNGNRGFRADLRCLAVITVDTRLFAGPEERNQPWIEGGLFAANFAMALHGLGVGTCLLNMSVLNETTQRLRSQTGIPDHDVVIMMMAIGYPGDNHRVARSPRRGIDEIAVFHE